MARARPMNIESPPPEPTLTTRQLARVLGCSIAAIREKLRRSPQELPPSIRLGAWRIRFINVDKWLEEKARAGR